MAEQLIRNEQVGGSIPFTSSTQKQGSLWRPCFCVNRIKGNRTRRAPAKGEGPVELRAAGGPKQSGARRGSSQQGERRSRRSTLHWRHTKQGSLWHPCFCVNRIKGNRTRRAPAKGEGPVELRAAGGPKQSGARRGSSQQGERRSRRSTLHWRHTYRLPACFSFSFFISASSSAGNGCQAAGSLR